jgi:glycogen(starch) synthase
MFGWEFPPYNRGGLGTACYGLTKGLCNKGVNVTFVLPKAGGPVHKSSHVNLLVASDYYMNNEQLRFLQINSLLAPYISLEEYNKQYGALSKQQMHDANMHWAADDLYGKDLFEEVYRYSQKAKIIAALEKFDVIHAHDWMTYQAGMEAKRVSGKPLVVHVHATEFDRTGGNPNQYVYDIERAGMHGADRIIAVSSFTKQKIVEHYGIPPQKIEVVHNAVTFTDYNFNKSDIKLAGTDKIVLFLGRITLQKGPDYFLYASKRVLDFVGKSMNIKFIFAGSGDMEGQMIRKAAELGITKNVLFAGWVTGKELDKLYAMADLYVMPSVSEPFGITPLEAMRNNTPCMISKQSGVSEVISHCLKVDFWDVDEMANKMIGVLKHNSLQKCLMENGAAEVRKFNWDLPAEKCINVYSSVLGG